MSILVNKDSRVLVQGITGSEGTFHTNQMIEYGTKIVAGVTPGKGGTVATDHNIPVYNSVEEAKNKENANTSIIFVPPRFAAEAIIESIYAGIKTIICISEGIPVNDMLVVKKILFSDLVIIKTVVLTIKIPPMKVCIEGTSPSSKNAKTIAHKGSRPAMSMLTI